MDQQKLFYRKELEKALGVTSKKPKLHSSEAYVWIKSVPPDGLFEYLHTPEVKASLYEMDVPAEFEQLLRSLDDITKTNGVLLVNGAINLTMMFLIASHENAEQIVEIRHKDWVEFDLDSSKYKYKEGLEEFESLFHVGVPDFLFELNHYHQSMHKLTQNSRYGFGDFDMYGLESLGGIFRRIFSGKNPEIKDVLEGRHEYHSLNYFPLFDFGADSVTQGLIFDYEENSFSPFIAYVGDTVYRGSKGIWDVLKRSISCDGGDFYWDKEEFSIEDLDEIIEPDEGYELARWFCDLATTGYLNFHNKPSIQFDGLHEARFDCSYPREEETRKTLEEKGYFVATSYNVYPLLPAKLEGNFHPLFSLDRLKSLLDTFQVSLVRGRHIEFNTMGVKKFVTREKRRKENVLRLMGLDNPEWMLKKKLQEEDIDIFFGALEDFCDQEIKEGRPHLAFFVGLHTWSCIEKKTTEFSAKLLEKVPDDICDPIIKTVAKLHAETRF